MGLVQDQKIYCNANLILFIFDISYRVKISAIKNSDADRCINYFYYLREFKIFTFDNETILIGVASNYAKKYPDAPEVWLINKNNVIDKIGDTNIEKYSLNFELSK